MHLVETSRKLRENKALKVLLHPGLVAHYTPYRREFAEGPLSMRSTPFFIEIELTNRCNLACTQYLRSRGSGGTRSAT